MEGLAISEVSVKSLEFSGRIDAEYYRPEMLQYERAVQEKTSIKLGDVANFLIGPFGSSFTTDNYTDDKVYRYIRGKDVKSMMLMDNDNVYMPEDDYTRLKRYALHENDILVSVVGTLGNSAIVSTQNLPAIFSCKSTVVRPFGANPKYLTVYLNSHFGNKLLVRKERGVIQAGLNLDDLKDLPVFLPTEGFQSRIAASFDESLQSLSDSKSAQVEAECVLLDALGLSDWTPPEPLAYAAKASEALAAGRLDARFFAPRIQALLDILSSDGRTISDVAKPRREKFRPERHVLFDYIEISDMDGAGATGSTRLVAAEAPSRATWHVRPGDIITSSVRPIRRLSAQIMPQQAGFVCSSGFVVVDPQDIAPEVLLTYLRLPVICELLDLYASASMYPSITDANIFNLPMPELPDAVASQIVAHVQNARAAKARAAALLDAAKRAVEIAIEDSEATALAHLATVEGAG